MQKVTSFTYSFKKLYNYKTCKCSVFLRVVVGSFSFLTLVSVQIKMANFEDNEPRVEEVDSDDEVPDLEEVEETANVVGGSSSPLLLCVHI